MDYTTGIISGFLVVFQWSNLLYCFIGVFIGTLVGVLPGIGPVGALSMLLPATFGMSPVSAVILFAGIYYGAAYGGSTTSILVNIPGEASSVVTCIDGYQMARNGRAGAALGISAIGSFIGGTFSVIALMFLVFPLAKAAVLFGPPEYFSLICMSMTIVVYLAHGSLIKAIIMSIVGLILSTVGLDFITGVQRFTFGSDTLQDGFGLVPVAMGVFGIAEVLNNIHNQVERTVFDTPLKKLLPSRDEWKRSLGPIIRGSFVGFPLGILPGGGAIIASFLSYGMEKRLSKNPEKFGKGAIEGVAGPETANNAGAGGAFIPLLAMGIPSNLVMALLLGALMIHGITPGPRMISQHPDIFWGVIASMYLGNAMLVVLNLPLIGLWVKVLKIPYRILMPLILLFCLIGVYSLNNNIVEIIVMIVFGLVGYCFRRLGYEEAPMVLAFVLGPLLERSFRQSLIISSGSFSIFFEKPLSAISLVISALLIVSSGFSYYKKTKERIPLDD
ncbi:MAG TPA: tripartite tricarboxylate transporter permease [Syntrophorhabdaceae bacterium]|nr:tripartite tricarboxylate transporter permease [Syntrophorhabdaceae bacterium]